MDNKLLSLSGSSACQDPMHPMDGSTKYTVKAVQINSGLRSTRSTKTNLYLIQHRYV